MVSFIFIDAGFQVTRNHLYQTLPTLFKQWSLSVEIMPTGLVDTWGNILHVGLGGNSEEYGDRTPIIWFAPGTTKMRINSAINGDKNYIISADPLPINEWTQIEISQLTQPDGVHQFTIRVAGTIFREITNTAPQEFSNVKVYTSDNYFSAANAMIANLTISTFPECESVYANII